MKLFLAGDVMTGRGIDQILGHPGDPTLHERWAKSAIDYVDLAERRNGPIPRNVDPSYVWGDVAGILEDRGVAARIINLETAITSRGEPWPQKGIHYRMHPANVDAITAADIDCCTLANNHLLDWSRPGLEETLATLAEAGLATTGAGLDDETAWQPVTIETEAGDTVVVSGVGATSSGIPTAWAAGTTTPGVALMGADPSETIERIAGRTSGLIPGEGLVVVSVHWGSNWGYEIPRAHRVLARELIDTADVDIVHGHSSHHPIGIEVYRGRPILYGCGDLINDYEGIGGHEGYRPELRVVYLLTMSTSGELEELELIPMRAERFSLTTASSEARRWLGDRLSRESAELGSRIDVAADGRLLLDW